MKKYLKLSLLILMAFFVYPPAVNAANCVGSYNLSVRSSKTSITAGSNVSFTVSFNSAKRFSSWSATFNYDKSKLTYLSGNTSIGAVFENPTTSKTYTYTFKAKATGTASFSFVMNELAGYDDAAFLCPGKKSASASVTINAPRELDTNNNLRNLVAEGYQLSPAFNKNTLKYNLNLPVGTQSININAQKESNYSSLSGTGVKELNGGNNEINIIVTAENGRTKVYRINAYVAEPDPINVKHNDLEYTVVRKAEDLLSPSATLTETTIMIDEEEVPALEHEKLKLKIIGLRDSDSVVKLFIYKENNYTPFTLLKSSGLELLISDKKVDNLDKEKLEVDETEYELFKEDKYFYFYASNLASAKENLYRFESLEGTSQIHLVTEEDVVALTDYDQYIIIGLASLLGLTYLIIIIKKISKSKKRQNRKDYKYYEEDDKIDSNLEKEASTKEDVEETQVTESKKKKKKKK